TQCRPWQTGPEPRRARQSRRARPVPGSARTRGLTVPTAVLARELGRRGLVPDPAQLAAIDALEDLRRRLVAAERAGRNPLARVRGLLRPPERRAGRGIYLWGGVGRGKTLLMDAFHASLP